MNTYVAIIDDTREEIAYVYDALEREHDLSPIYGDWTKGEDRQALIDTIFREPKCVVLLDIYFHGEEKGFEIYDTIMKKRADVPVLILTTREDYETFRRYNEIGAFDYITKGEPVNTVINRIRFASEDGTKYFDQFMRLVQSFSSEPEEAIYQIKQLFPQYANLTAYKRHNELLRKYLQRPFSEYLIPLTEVLSLMRENCFAIQKEDPADHHNLAELAILYLHFGETDAAVGILRTILPKLNPTAEITGEILNWLEKDHFRRYRNQLSAEELGRILIDDYETNYEGHLQLVDILRRRRHRLFEQAAAGLLSLMAEAWSVDREKILSRVTLEYFLRFGKEDPEKLIAKQDPSCQQRLAQFFKAVFAYSIRDEELYNTGLTSLCKFLFDAFNFGKASDHDNELSYSLLDEFLVGLYGAELQLDGAVTLVCELMGSLRLSDVKKMQSVLESIRSEHPSHWWEALQGFISHLRQTNSAKLRELICNNESYLLSILDPDSLTWIGNILDETLAPSTESQVFYVKSLELLLLQSQTENDLLEARSRVDILRRNGINIPAELEERFRGRITEIQRPLKLWDGQRVAVMGGRPDRELAYKEKLERAFGGQYEWFDSNEDKSLKRLSSSIQSGGVNIVIYITGWGSHKANDIVVPVVEQANKYSDSAQRVKLIRIPKERTGAGEVVDFIEQQVRKEK